MTYTEKNCISSNLNTHFSDLCELTLTACNIDAFPDDTFTAVGNGWCELAKAWEVLFPNGSYGIFEETVHRIMWGIPSYRNVFKYESIIRIVADELLSDGPAFAAWDTYVGCETAIDTVTSDMTPLVENEDEYNRSIEHYHYVCDKALWKIRFSKTKYAYKSAAYKSEIMAYENAIKKIVPSSIEWNDAEWNREDLVFDELLTLYGVDYRDIDPVEYGRILLLLMNNPNAPNARINETWYACNISNIPFSLATVIWPVKTQDRILRLFMRAAKAAEIEVDNGNPNAWLKNELMHPVGLFEYQDIMKSWLWQFVNNWLASQNTLDKFGQDIKRTVFNINVTC